MDLADFLFRHEVKSDLVCENAQFFKEKRDRTFYFLFGKRQVSLGIAKDDLRQIRELQAS